MDVAGTRRGQEDLEYATGLIVASGAWGSDILTVQHAVDGAWNIHATVDNRRRVPVRVVAADKVLDIALLRAQTPRLPAAPLGTLRDARPGRLLGLEGYPIPDQFHDQGFALATSVVSGRLSSFRRNAIEVTIPIVPGESGAPVFLADNGAVIGMAESRFESEHSIGFALPVTDERRFLHRVDGAHGF